MGWLALPVWPKLLFHEPLGPAVCAVSLAALAIAAWRWEWWARERRCHYAVLLVAALAEAALSAGWRLIGPG